MRPFLLMPLLLLPAAPALAQDAGDVVVMRRTIQAANPQGAWTLGETVVEPGCTERSPARTPVVCISPDGRIIDAGLCMGAKPSGPATMPEYSTCDHAWHADAWSPWSSTCSGQATRTRTVACRRTGADVTPATVDASRCTAARPAASETSSIRTDCSLPNADLETGTTASWGGVDGPRIRTDAPHGGRYAIGATRELLYYFPSGLPQGRYSFSVWHRCSYGSEVQIGLLTGSGHYAYTTGRQTCDATWRKATFTAENPGGYRFYAGTGWNEVHLDDLQMTPID